MRRKSIIRSILMGASTCLACLILFSAANAATPEVTVVNPSEGTIGTVFTISGADFGTSRGLVFIGNSLCKTLSWGDTSIMAQVLLPMPPGEYTVVVRFPGGFYSRLILPNAFSIRPPELDPPESRPNFVSPGDVVTVDGKFFGQGYRIPHLEIENLRGDRIACRVLDWTMDTITFELPDGIPDIFGLHISNAVGSDTQPWWGTFVQPGKTPTNLSFVPVPVESRVVGEAYTYTMEGIKVGSNTYAPPAPTTCGSPSDHGFQVIVLDRGSFEQIDGSLELIDNRAFNVPCGNQAMIDFLSSLGDTSKYPVAPLVIVSSLDYAPPTEVCGYSSNCPLGQALEGLGGTSIFRSNYTKTLQYYIPLVTGINFSYSLIGIPGLGQNQGYELNNWDHRAVAADSENINASIQGYFVLDINYKWAFTYPEFVQIETRTRATIGNIIKVGGDSYFTDGMPGSDSGGFQVVVLDRDTLKPAASLTQPAASLTETNKSFYTNQDYGACVTCELDTAAQQGMYDYLNSLMQSDPSQKFVVIISSIGNKRPPIDYKSSYFTDLIRLIGDYYGGTTGILNNLGPAAPSIVTYSLVGMNNVGNTKYGLGVLNTVEESGPDQSLKVVMHKDKQGWYTPVTTYTGEADAVSKPDFNLLPVALQARTAWPLYDPRDDASDPDQKAAYQYISSHLGVNTNDIRKLYTQYPIDPGSWSSYCIALDYPVNPDPYFSEDVFNAMKTQLCGDKGEFNLVNYINLFMNDMTVLLGEMQIASGSTMETVYNMVKSTIHVDDGNYQAKYDAIVVIRGMLKIASALDPEPISKAVMGAVNGVLWMGMHLSKEPSGPDYTSINTAVSSLSYEMNNLWTSCESGMYIVLDMIKSDWGKLQYVGNKLTTSQNDGGWMYGDTDKAHWKEMVTNSLEANYFQSLIPAVWKIDYLLGSTTIPHPRNYKYHFPEYTYYCDCQPYCVAGNESAFWVNQFAYESIPDSYDWFVLDDGINLDWTCNCGEVQFDNSVDLRDVLFGEGPLAVGQKLQLEPAVFYERWLPSSVYSHPIGYSEQIYEYKKCSP